MKRLLQSTYVDDIITGAKMENEAFELYAQSKGIFRQGGFNLRKFLTNSETLQTRIDHAEGLLDPNLPKIDSDTHATHGTQTMKGAEECKILRVTWNPNNDCLVFDLSDLSNVAADLQPTKRNLVSLVGRINDPLGFLAPVTIKKFCSRSSISPNLIGTAICLKNCTKNGELYLLTSRKLYLFLGATLTELKAPRPRTRCVAFAMH